MFFFKFRPSKYLRIQFFEINITEDESVELLFTYQSIYNVLTNTLSNLLEEVKGRVRSREREERVLGNGGGRGGGLTSTIPSIYYTS